MKAVHQKEEVPRTMEVDPKEADPKEVNPKEAGRWALGRVLSRMVAVVDC